MNLFCRIVIENIKISLSIFIDEITKYHICLWQSHATICTHIICCTIFHYFSPTIVLHSTFDVMEHYFILNSGARTIHQLGSICTRYLILDFSFYGQFLHNMHSWYFVIPSIKIDNDIFIIAITILQNEWTKNHPRNSDIHWIFDYLIQHKILLTFSPKIF